MPDRCLLYYITDRTQFPGPETDRRLQLLAKIKQASIAGVDYIQLREKDLPTRDLETLAREAVSIVRNNSHPAHPTRILINSRTDIALATQADGVHLRSHDISVADARKIWTSAPQTLGASPRPLLIAISCHTLADVQAAQQNAADFAVFAPVFEKKEFGKKFFEQKNVGKQDAPSSVPAGLKALRQACRYKIPVLALGGVTLDNAAACLAAGAAGIAAIRLFQENDIANLVTRLRSYGSD
jgi:thiamine-phosphate pyrophosphorylase